MGVLFISCENSKRQLIERAERELQFQRGDTARSLFLQILQSHNRRDEIRYRAYCGLIETLRGQLHNYREAADAMERLIKEFEHDTFRREAILQWRLELAKLYRDVLEAPFRAREVILPWMKETISDPEANLEIALVLLSDHEFDQAERFSISGWNQAVENKRCDLIFRFQMAIIHVYQGMKRCDRALEWSLKRPFADCQIDEYSLGVERAHCYEILGESQRALEELTKLKEKQPDNFRVSRLLTFLEERERRKKQR